MRLIDADALKQADFQDFSSTDVFAAIDTQRTVDAIPVVRCRECTHSYFDEYGYLACAESGAMLAPEEGDYCSRGEYCSNQSAQVRKKEGTLDAAAGIHFFINRQEAVEYIG